MLSAFFVFDGKPVSAPPELPAAPAPVPAGAAVVAGAFGVVGVARLGRVAAVVGSGVHVAGGDIVVVAAVFAAVVAAVVAVVAAVAAAVVVGFVAVAPCSYGALTPGSCEASCVECCGCGIPSSLSVSRLRFRIALLE